MINSASYLKNTINRLDDNLKYLLGFPVRPKPLVDFSYLATYLNRLTLNIGDPYYSLSSGGTEEYERKVLNWFYRFYDLDIKEGWGYCTSGGTEGNFFAIWQAREMIKAKYLYYPQSAHYSIPKAANIFNLIPIAIKTDRFGSMIMEDLSQKLVKNEPAIVVAVMGNTITGSIDDVRTIKQILINTRCAHYIHADAAFGGIIVKYTDYKLSFKDGLDSISLSGHKFFGLPIVSGIFLSKKEYQKSIAKKSNYIRNYDNTLLGSRCGIVPILFYEIIKQYGESGFKKLVEQSLSRATIVKQKLKKNDIAYVQPKNSINVAVKLENDEILNRWFCASNTKLCAICCFEGVEDKITEFIDDYIALRQNKPLKPRNVRENRDKINPLPY